MTDDPVPVAVVGAGNMGANHVRVYDQLPGAELVEIVETDPERAGEIREEYDVSVVDDVAALERATAATVAVPNRFHREVAVSCIESGLDVLVEKPLAMNVEDAQVIVDAAQEAGAVLQVGHIERFNPAVETLQEVLSDEQVIAIETHRLGPFNEHLSTESVVFDLMIHDIDVITALIGSLPSSTSSYGTTARSSEVDHAVAMFEFDDGVLGTATASHVTHGKVRRMDLTTENAYITLDYQQQGIVVQRRGVEHTEPLLNQSGYRTETVTESPYVRTREPLKNELEHFLQCVADRTMPRVSGREGINAVQIAKDVIDRL